jgi:hypothetical protein
VNVGSLRKRLDRLEKILKPQFEAAVLANAPAAKLSEQEERDELLELERMFSFAKNGGPLSDEEVNRLYDEIQQSLQRAMQTLESGVSARKVR